MTYDEARSPEMTALLRRLRQMGACSEGIALVRRYAMPGWWWAASERGDHMLWLAARAGVRRQDLVLAACACARLALPHVPVGEARPLRAIEIAERWARGEATRSQVQAAASAAASAAGASREWVLRECARLARTHIPWFAVAAALARTKGER